MVGADELRAAMRRFPAGVAVVTVALDDERFGITVASLVSLSLEPPLVGISIGLQSSIHEPLRRARRFAVNVLAGDQGGLAQHFARSGLPPLVAWTGIALRESALAEPLLEGALAWLECATQAEYEAGDHTIFVGSVESVELGRDEDGLAYARSDYHSV
ncbi:MAG: flavin reductase [Thermoleophilia bacterium]|nr:flavin reductase [Thermoleophilia bacterium]